MRKRLIGGGLLLLCACIGLAAALSLLLMALADLRSESALGLEIFGVIVGLPMTILSIVGVVGGVFALVGRAWLFVVLASGLALPSTTLPEAFLFPIGPFLGIIAVILLINSRNEFRALDGKSEPWP